MRLDRFLSQNTPHGRRGIRPLLSACRVSVDGHITRDPDHQITSFSQVTLDGKTLQAGTEAVYLMLHKPAGFLSATSDPVHPTVMELLHPRDHPEQLHIAGRLDRASTGLLILTNDGRWSRDLTNPSDEHHQGIGKTYLVDTAEPITEETKIRFEQGIYFAYEDLTTGPADLQIISPTRCELTIYEGRYHQIKRMFHAVGNRVTALHRTSIGPIHLDPALDPGESRRLHREETDWLIVRTS
ncbi:pseudouridine synthase [Verrucomicrobiaceae bacterium N1E253]|uniref:Pseudouridine synthase n=1 Tax=Oceaniferula marina TaxID=2748318 RepID=A0A851GEL1_9BACT|nr:pseudouridine synthase [Oceaniferula marina]NWK55342.1 pseudouridine synthase [Oceaniferula marina]